MIVARKIFSFAFLILLATNVYAQNDKQKAKELGEKAIKLEDENKIDEALPLLAEAQSLDPGNYNYPYEVAYCYREKKEYKKGIAEMQKVMAYSDIKEECYQMLGNLYDQDGDSVMALKTYADGLKKFPNAGRLYLESGNIYLIRKQYAKALPYYEKGIEVEPAFPSNYYRASYIYMLTTEPIWGMIYGELFMNLERNSGRTADMSKWLYDGYKDNIVIKSKDSMSVHFCQNHKMYVSKDGKKLDDVKAPFSMNYEMLIMLSMSFGEDINTESLCSLRSKFIDVYYEKGFDKTYPNVLFEYQNKIKSKGFTDAYNHWILMKGDESAFIKWRTAHLTEWDSFTKWFDENPLQITSANKFLSPNE